jgi:hypothetical protein
LSDVNALTLATLVRAIPLCVLFVREGQNSRTAQLHSLLCILVLRIHEITLYVSAVP